MRFILKKRINVISYAEEILRFCKDDLLLILKDQIKNLSKELPIRLVLLFGSYAVSRYIAASDVDLLAVIERG